MDVFLNDIRYGRVAGLAQMADWQTNGTEPISVRCANERLWTITLENFPRNWRQNTYLDGSQLIVSFYESLTGIWGPFTGARHRRTVSDRLYIKSKHPIGWVAWQLVKAVAYILEKIYASYLDPIFFLVGHIQLVAAS